MPDVPGMKWLWKLSAGRKLKKLRVKFPNVKRIYTHAGYGESGHPHHFLTHNAAKKAFTDKKIYTTASEFAPLESGKLDETDVGDKMNIIRDIYSTQVNMLVRWCDWFENYLHYEVLNEEE